MALGNNLGPKQVNVVPAPGVPGRFASGNPRVAVVAGPGGLVAGPGGVTVAKFCFAVPGALDVDSGAQVVVSGGGGTLVGLVANESQGLIQTPFSNASMVIPQGFMVTAYIAGDYWVANAGGQCFQGQKAYASLIDGSVSFGATGSPTTATSTASTIAPATWSTTAATIASSGTPGTGSVLNVTGAVTGTIVPGATVTGTNIPSGTLIASQLTGTTGGIGTYALNYGEISVPTSEAVSGAYGLLTVGGTVVGTWGVGAVVGAGGTSAGTIITGRGTGTGAGGTYYVNNSQTVNSAALTATTTIETRFAALSGGLNGEQIKIGYPNTAAA